MQLYKTCRNALSKHMTNVLYKDMSNKNESQLGKFFWHQSAKCKSRLLAKCPISEKSN